MAVALLIAAPLAPAQDGPRRTDPLDPEARVPAVVHRSALAGYRPLDDRRVPWREANETVNRIGGWRTYLRQAQQPEPPASAPGAHGGHGKAGR
ncbi:MAG: hypothetical protein Fur0014_16690 [Rubrivivax sp.]